MLRLEKVWVFWETSPQYVVFWLHHGMNLFWCFSCLGEGEREDKAICPACTHFLLPSELQSWAVWPLSRWMSRATKSKLAVTFKLFSHRLPVRENTYTNMYVHFILLLSVYIFLYLSLYKYNGLCREHFSGCYCTEYSKSVLYTQYNARVFLFWLEYFP